MITARKDGLAVLTVTVQFLLGTLIFLIWTEGFLFFTTKLAGERPPYFLCLGSIALGLVFSYRQLRSKIPVKGKWKWLSCAMLGLYQIFLIGSVLLVTLFTFKEADLSRSFILGFLILYGLILTLSIRVIPRLILNGTNSKDLKKFNLR